MCRGGYNRFVGMCITWVVLEVADYGLDEVIKIGGRCGGGGWGRGEGGLGGGVGGLVSLESW